MTKRILQIVLLGTVLVLTACESDRVEVLKSPCVGLEGSPCGPKRQLPQNPQLHQQPLVPEQS
ncbi:MAG: hypothetical protein ACOYNL_08845 [Rickettsiales bacterium]